MKSRHVASFRRRKEGKTDYKKRLNLLVSGKHRLVIRVTGKKVIAQIVEYVLEGDKTLASATSSELKNFGWTEYTKNIPSAYLTGLLCAKRAVKKKMPTAILDLGLHTPIKGSRVFAALAGAVDGGLEIPHEKTVLPIEARLNGSHINEKTTSAFEKAKAKINSE